MPQRLKRQPENIYHSKKSFKPAKGLIPLGGGGGTEQSCYPGRLNTEVLTILYVIFERRRYFFRAEFLLPLSGLPPGKYEKLPTCSYPPCRPRKFFVHSEVKKNL